MARGGFLDQTVVVEMRHLTQRPLVFMVTENGPERNADPRTMVDQFGVVSNAWDWAIESGDALVDKQETKVGVLTSYVFPADEQEFLVGHSLGPAFDRVTTLMRHRAYGDRVCALVEEHWPTTWRWLREGAGMPNNYGLCKIRTDEEHWFIGTFLMSRSATTVDVDPVAVKKLQDTAFEVLGNALEYPGNLPGLLDVIQADPTKERLETVGKVVDGLLMILQVFDHVRG